MMATNIKAKTPFMPQTILCNFCACLTIAVVSAGCATTHTDTTKDFSAKDADYQFQAAGNRPPTAKTLYAMAKILAAQSKDAECEYILTRIIREYPDFCPAYCDMAELRMRQDRVTDAMASLRAGLQRCPAAATLINDYGMCRLIKGDYDGAFEDFRRAACLCPKNARYRANMALTLGMLRRYDESLALYEQVVPSGEAHYNLSVIAQQNNDAPRAGRERALARQMGFKPTDHCPDDQCPAGPCAAKS
jgi:tetratricopeptide (TPR) repeat protein